MFLFVPDEIRHDPLAPEFTTHINQTSNDWSFGFDATQLAAALGIAVDELLDANRGRRLTLEQIEADTPTGEGARAKRYTFSVGEKEGSLTIETPMHFGSA